LRKLPKPRGGRRSKEWHRLADAKEAHLAALEASCRHGRVLATGPARILGGPGGPRKTPARRICLDCGASAARGSLVPGLKVLFRRRAIRYLGYFEYGVAQGEILRRIGIDL
jgi:hypothetical protein